MGSPTPGFPTDQLAETTLAPTHQKVFQLHFFPLLGHRSSWEEQKAAQKALNLAGKLSESPHPTRRCLGWRNSGGSELETLRGCKGRAQRIQPRTEG